MKWTIIGLAILFGIPATLVVGYFALISLPFWGPN